VLGTAVTKICDVQVGRTGLRETDARAAGFDPLTVAVDSTTQAGYYPGAKPIRTKFRQGWGALRLSAVALSAADATRCVVMDRAAGRAGRANAAEGAVRMGSEHRSQI